MGIAKYDYIVVGAGLFGATFAEQMCARGKKVLVLEKREHIAGNAYTESIAGIQVHKYGAHVFHTNNKEIWDYVNGFARFNRFTNSPIANYRGRLYTLPFNMYTFYQLWGVTKPADARKIIQDQCSAARISNPQNLEEQAISMVGLDVFQTLIKGYTEKQWGRPCNKLPASIIKRIPVRFNFDSNYYDALYQGIPIGGYTSMVNKMLSGVEIRLRTNYLDDCGYWNSLAGKIIYTGPIDAFFSFCYGPLAYRSLSFETEVLEIENYQGNAVVNYTERDIPFTRIIEHKHFEYGKQKQTVITREYSKKWEVGEEPYYPIGDETNLALYQRYKGLSKKSDKVIFCGRLGSYEYFDMDVVVKQAIDLAKSLSR